MHQYLVLQPWRSALLVFFFVFPHLWALAAEPSPPSSQPAGSQPAGEHGVLMATLFGEKIYADELRPPPSTRPWSDADLSRFASSELARRIIGPLREQFIKENKLEATPEELKQAAESFKRQWQRRDEENRKKLDDVNSRLQAEVSDSRQKDKLIREKQTLEQTLDIDKGVDAVKYQRGLSEISDLLEKERAELARLKQQRGFPGVGASERGRLERRIKESEDKIKGIEWLRKPWPEQMADWMVGPWKFNRALYRKYGGTVIWQQAGIEAVGAMRAWLEEHERAGDFQILDPKLRDEFWKYYRREDHPSQIKKADPFERAPWEEEPATRPE